MPNIDILVLAIVQGITEFLPISSSGHLILVPQLYCWPDQGLTMDVAAHVGTLLAVLVYFWRDLFSMSQGAWKVLRGKRDPRARLIGLLLVAAVPGLAVGFAVDVYFGAALRSPLVVGCALIGFGLLLYAADKIGITVRRIEHMSWGNALAIGLFQCLAFIPGTSRSGITMTMARLIGFERPDAARFSFLLAIPTIAAAGLYKGWQLVQGADMAALQLAGLMVALSAIAGFLAIAFLMYWVRRASFTPFVVYRIALGLFVLYLFYLGSGPNC